MEDIKNNPYYIDNNYPITEHQKQLLKENNIYILTALSSIIKNKGETSSVRPAYKKKILSGKLYNPDNVLGLNTNNLGEKLKALFIALDKEENKKKFCNSYFNIAISTITSGNNIENYDADWLNYSQATTCAQELKGKTPLQAALACYKEDPKMPVGLNMMTVIDTIIQKNKYGQYEIQDITAAQGDLLYKASCKQVEDLKSNKKFKESFRNEKLEKDLDETENGDF